MGGGEEVVHGPGGFEAELADKRRELRVVANAVEREVHKDGLAGGSQAAERDGVEDESVVQSYPGRREGCGKTECEFVSGGEGVD